MEVGDDIVSKKKLLNGRIEKGERGIVLEIEKVRGRPIQIKILFESFPSPVFIGWNIVFDRLEKKAGVTIMFQEKSEKGGLYGLKKK